VRAPSGGNSQPWSIESTASQVTISLAAQHTSSMDVALRGSAVALGAALFNLDPQLAELNEPMLARETNRHHGVPQAIDEDVIELLTAARSLGRNAVGDSYAQRVPNWCATRQAGWLGRAGPGGFRRRRMLGGCKLYECRLRNPPVTLPRYRWPPKTLFLIASV